MAVLPNIPKSLHKKQPIKKAASRAKVKQTVFDKEEIPRFGPCSLKQQMMLLDMTTDLLVVGGGSGSGKSHTALVKALSYVKDPAAIVVIVRLTYPLLKAPGGLISESKHIYPYFGAVYKDQKAIWEFPNGAIIKFLAMPQDLSDLQGMQFSNILVDEGAEATLEDILALRGRLRAVRYKGKLNMCITCNPSRESWLYNFVSFSLDAEGVPKEGTENIIRWFVILNGKIFWGDSRESLFAEHGKGYILGDTFRPLSFRFIPATIYDNPIVLKNNPDYLADLMAQSRVNQLRFLKGSWTAKTEGSSFIKRDWFQYVDRPPVDAVNRVRAYDTAATIPSEVSPDPDYTAGVLISRNKEGIYFIENAIHFRLQPDGVLKEVSRISCEDDGLDVQVLIERDVGAAGAIAATFMQRYLAERGSTIHMVNTNNAGKLKRFLPFASMCESGAVRIVRYDVPELDAWIEPYLVELEEFTGARNKVHDDFCDATSCGFNYLCRSVVLPNFVLPSLTKASPLVRIN
jgi:predicted phage terminase large subunit-like protein